MIIITFPDKSKVQFSKKEITPAEIAREIGEGLARAALAAKVRGKIVDLNYPITEDSDIRIITSKDAEGKEILRHSTAHLMSQAVNRLFKNVKQGVGPAIEDGFYQDFKLERNLSPEDLPKIEEEMKKIVKEDIPFIRKEISKKDALKLFSDDPFKIELINEITDSTVTIYESKEYSDLCRGPHIPSTGKIKAFKLTKVAGAYWKGSEKNPQLQRIYGVSFDSESELKKYLTLLQEAEKRDHRKIGKELDLIMIHELAPGMPFFLPKGMIMLIELTKFAREYSYGEGYKEVRTPQLFNSELWKISGHWDHYKDNMFIMHHAEDNIDICIKPMNCPGHMLVFKRDTHSYKDLPLRIAETTTLYRNEKSGTLAGLTRVRALSQDDTHIFAAKEQIFDEIKVLLEKIKTIYKIFDLRIDEIDLSTMPEDHMGEVETWDLAESNLKKALDDLGLKYNINKGDGAFYGPKIDVKVKDALGRQWQLATIQLDFQLPQRFGLEYTDADGSRKTPVVIHRAILGTMERFLGIIIEHYAGWFPLWLSPEQVRVIAVSDKFNKYAEEVTNKIKEAGIRVEFDNRAESTSKKVLEAQMQKIPLVVNVGEKEETAKTVAVRTNKDGKVKFGMKIEDFIEKVLKNIKDKSNELKF
jgi:threonyl-tRNA synthetase